MAKPATAIGSAVIFGMAANTNTAAVRTCRVHRPMFAARPGRAGAAVVVGARAVV
jgi:hypothetical protein